MNNNGYYGDFGSMAEEQAAYDADQQRMAEEDAAQAQYEAEAQAQMQAESDAAAAESEAQQAEQD
jgi:hypothetical protein